MGWVIAVYAMSTFCCCCCSNRTFCGAARWFLCFVRDHLFNFKVWFCFICCGDGNPDNRPFYRGIVQLNGQVVEYDHRRQQAPFVNEDGVVETESTPLIIQQQPVSQPAPAQQQQQQQQPELITSVSATVHQPPSQIFVAPISEQSQQQQQLPRPFSPTNQANNVIDEPTTAKLKRKKSRRVSFKRLSPISPIAKIVRRKTKKRVIIESPVFTTPPEHMSPPLTNEQQVETIEDAANEVRVFNSETVDQLRLDRDKVISGLKSVVHGGVQIASVVISYSTPVLSYGARGVANTLNRAIWGGGGGGQVTFLQDDLDLVSDYEGETYMESGQNLHHPKFFQDSDLDEMMDENSPPSPTTTIQDEEMMNLHYYKVRSPPHKRRIQWIMNLFLLLAMTATMAMTMRIYLDIYRREEQRAQKAEETVTDFPESSSDWSLFWDDEVPPPRRRRR
ncbi:Oidioi.mRNA.OKI2018_I69.chr1.g2765.t1.cds [Oikopleura dioica]|uniref:Oidioi.mRNA.OKI2018_I69.chr1.g2765.t1.cds n=1 Tax=Oikopleura dioica TaxID=34765 RepID=A0ABN7SVL3_OIKDI|nr:Oidioi.mRNA.OKI2018_I69.chr1.g2765.t1.cds [Oikopleura dioica]